MYLSWIFILLFGLEFNALVILSFILMLKEFQLWIKSYFSGAPVSFQLAPSFYNFILSIIFPYFLVPEYVPVSSCIFPAPALQSTIFPRGPGSFYREMVFRNQDQNLDVLNATEMPLLLGSVSRKGQETHEWVLIHAPPPYLCLYLCTCICVYIFKNFMSSYRYI